MHNFTSFNDEVTTIKEWLQKEYSQISTGRANPALLDSIQIDSYGALQPVKAVASITLEDARTLRISPWDKNQIKAIETAILDARLPISLATDDAGLRASVPMMTEENRKDIVRLVKEKLEEARVRVRGAREKAVKDIDAGGYSDDEAHTFKDDLQKLVDAANDELQAMFAKKETDVMSV